MGTTTLDGFFAHVGSDKVDVLKMDIQGGELAALRGMERIAESNRHIKLFIEWWPEGLARSGVAPRDVLGWFHAHGFTVSAVLEDGPRRVDDAWLLRPEAAGRAVNLFLARESGP